MLTAPTSAVTERAARRRRRALLGGLALSLALAACTSTSPGATTTSSSSTASSPAVTSSSPTSSSPSPVVSAGSDANVWKSSVDPTALPLGDGKISSTPKAGYLDSCTRSFRGGGARHAGAWIDTAAGTWNLTDKIAVQGSTTWPAAHYAATVSGGTRTITTDDLPEHVTTGTFPISPSDPAYQYDTNPNHIAAQSVTLHLPADPTAAATPSCTGLGPIGVLDDGVFLYNALDAGGRDAVAHETQDSCNGHPDGRDRYHYHDVPVCIRDRATGSSTLVGYALDGYGIYVERDASGALPTDADLDACHGRTSPVMWDGKLTTIYHYDATLEYPYTVGCYHGTPVPTPRG